jgi:hypothetical protein
MAYSTGSASTLIALLDTLRVALIAESWTIHRWDNTWLAAQPNGGPLVFHWVISSTTSTNHPAPRLYQNGSTSYDGGAAWNAQPGQVSTPAETYSESWIEPFGVYHLFVGSDYAHLVTRADDGMWRHALAGMMEPASSASAAYLQSVLWFRNNASHTHNPSAGWNGFSFGTPSIDSGSAARRWAWVWMDGVGWRHINTAMSTTNNALPVFRGGELDNQIQSLWPRLRLRAANEFNALAPMLPGTAALASIAQDGTYHLPGHAKDMRLVSMEYLQAGDLITIGAEEWLAFPAINRGYTAAGSMIPASGMIGYAYRRSIT